MKAFITGASSGIGAEFAKQLAKRKYDLVLLGRNKKKLDSLAKFFKEKYFVSCEIICADFSIEEDIDRARKFLGNEDIDLLINNAGFGLNSEFMDSTLKENLSMMKVHNEATVIFTYVVLKKMLQKKRGCIINVASIAGWLPARKNALYSSTKIFLINFSKALSVEVRNKGIIIQALCPGLTYTGFHSTDKYNGFKKSIVPRLFWMKSEEVVQKSLNALEKGKVVYIPGIFNKLIVFFGKRGIVFRLLFHFMKY